jgi:EpsI family protein
MVARAIVVVAMLAATAGYTARAAHSDVPVSRSPLPALPLDIDGWQGFDAAPFSDDIVAQLGVDDYINRRYVRGSIPVTVYVGYYSSQRQGDTIHSPQNCLPGAGWQPVSFERTNIQAGGTSVPVNRYLIEKGLDRQAVIYWYEGRGRSIANEYANKAWLMVDAARLRRTDGALVRMITPVVNSSDSPSGAFDRLTAFAAALFPRLKAHVP